MKNLTDENLVLHLSSRIKFLEKHYSNIYILMSKILLLKPQEFLSQNRILPIKETFKTLPKPEFSFEDHKEVPFAILDSAKASLKDKLDTSKLTEIFPIVESLSIQIMKYTQGRLLEKLLPTTNKVIENEIKYTEKKIKNFQREARKPSIERKNESRDLTPKKPPTKNLSVSPSEKKVHFVNQENLELKESLKRIQDERDLLKAWKENVLKDPTRLAEECSSIVKQQELFIKKLVISNKVLISKVQALVNSVMRFIKDTSGFQKVLREKEGFVAMNFYEDEKSKIKVKLEEISDVKDIQVFLVDFPFFGQNGNFDFSQFTEKYLSIESENKTLKIQLKNLHKKLQKSLQTNSPLTITSSISENPINTQSPLHKETLFLKSWVQSQIQTLSLHIDQTISFLSSKLSEKEKLLSEFRSKFSETFKESLKSLIELKENVKNSLHTTPNTEVLTNQIKSLEFLIEQNRFYKEVEIQELTQTNELLEKQKIALNEEIRALGKEKNEFEAKILQLGEVEQNLQAIQMVVKELETQNLTLGKKIREFKQKEIEFDEIKAEKNILELKVEKFLNEIEGKDSLIVELQKNLSLEQIKSGSCMEEMMLKENTVEKELELVKIELKTYKMQICVLENINEDLEKKVKNLEG